MGRTSPDLQQKNLEIKPGDKFSGKLLKREVSVSDRSSFRVYYGDLSGSVPFLWETTPGTPKHPSLNASLPPLTPPPSYHTPSTKPNRRRTSRSGLLQILFHKSAPKKGPVKLSSESSVSSSSSSSSLSSLWSCSMSPRRNQGKSRFSTPGSSFDSRVAEDEQEAIGSPTSTLCFAIGRGAAGKLRGCYAW